MLRWRLLLGIVVIAILVGLCWLDEQVSVRGIVLFPLMVLLVWLASGEAIYLMEAGGMRPVRWVVHVGNLLIVTTCWGTLVIAESGLTTSLSSAESSRAHSALAGVMTLLALFAGVLLAFGAEMRRYQKPGGAAVNLAGAVFAMVYVGVLLSFVVHLRMAWGMGALVSLVLVAKMADTGAYTVGRLIGRRKMAPALSPGKTIEGAIGSMVFACGTSWAFFRWVSPGQGPWWSWAVFGLVVGGSAMVGDLAESLIKRDVQRKDSSHWVPGFGGVLDMLDSLLFAAPAAYACWAFGLVKW